MNIFGVDVGKVIAEFFGITILPQRSIGPFTATVTIEEIATDDLEITKQPVQQGASITDHAFMQPAQLNVKIIFNDDDGPLADIYTRLRELQSSAEPFDVVTGKRSYTNMLIKSLGQTTDDKTENVLSISMALQEVIITAVTVVTVPERRKQANPGKTGATENAGKKSAQPAEQKRRSALRALAG